MTGGITTIYIAQNCDFGNIFMKTPRVLIEEEMFAILDNHDRMAYTVMLDKAALCAKNGWVDSEGHVFIYFTVEEACRVLKLGRTKVAKIFQTLTKVGLIERVRQGLGRPAIIYVKVISVEEKKEDRLTPCNPAEIHRRPLNESPDNREIYRRPLSECLDDREEIVCDQIVDNSAIRPLNECLQNVRRPLSGTLDDCEEIVCNQIVDNSAIRPLNECLQNVRRPLSGTLDDRETVLNKIDSNNTEYSNIININPIHQSDSVKKDDRPDRIMTDDTDSLRRSIRRLIHRHIDYNDFEYFRPDDLPMVDAIVELMTDVIMTDDREIIISRIPRNGNLVRQRFMLMKSDVIEYVIDSVKRVTTHIWNMRQYLLTSLYNAPDTIRNYYNSIFLNSIKSRYGYSEAAYV